MEIYHDDVDTIDIYSIETAINNRIAHARIDEEKIINIQVVPKEWEEKENWGYGDTRIKTHYKTDIYIYVKGKVE